MSAGFDGQRIGERRAERGQVDLELVAGFDADAIDEAQRRGAEEVQVHVARHAVLAVLEVVVLEVREAVAHVAFAGEEGLLPEHRAPAADAAISDGWITAKTKIALLTTTGVSAGDINVDTVDGRVTLHGTVSSAEEKARAEHEARKVHGVREVRNLLQVVPTGREEAVKAGDAEVEERVERALRDDRGLAGSDESTDSRALEADIGLVLTEGLDTGSFDPKAMSEMLEILVRHGLEVPTAMTVLSRALLTLEGTLRTIDPSFNLAHEATELLPEFAQQQHEQMQEQLEKEVLRAKAEANGLPLSAMIKDDDRCIRCGLCAVRCPTDAMTMEKFQITERYAPSGETV